MNIDDPMILQILRRSMVARIATLSRNGRPSVNPLYFIFHEGKVWLGTADWTLAARNVKADPRVSLLFGIERTAGSPIVHLRGQAAVRTDAPTIRAYNPRVALKYLLPLGGMYSTLTHLRQFWLRRYYVRQNGQKGVPCVIEVIPEQVQLFEQIQ